MRQPDADYGASPPGPVLGASVDVMVTSPDGMSART
jgi:hypothetical protein